MPSATRIGTNVFKVEAVPTLVDEKGNEAWGVLRSADDTMIISKAASPSRQKESFLHEVLHGVGFSMGDDIKEALVNRLSLGLYRWMLDNPDTVRWLLKEDTGS